jgi:hypothetical protein
MNLSRSIPQTSSSSRLGQALDQHSTRLILQYLERLDRLDRCVHEEVQEIRGLFMDLLDNCQSDVTMEDSLGGYDSTINPQTRLDGPQGKLAVCAALPSTLTCTSRHTAPQFRRL